MVATLLRAGLTAAMIIGAALLGLAVAGPAAAVPRCAGDCPTLSVNTTRPAAGTALTVTGDDFGGSDRVSLTLRGATHPLGSAQTNASGAFRTTLTLPSGVAGLRPIVASDPITAQQVRQVLRIAAPNRTGIGRGTNGTNSERSARDARVAIIGLGALGVVLLIGGGLLLLTRRREHVSV